MPYQPVVDIPGLPDQMIEDLALVATVSPSQIKELASALAAQTGFLTEQGLANLVGEEVSENIQGAAVFSTLQNLEPELLPFVLERLDHWRSSSESGMGRFPDSHFRALTENLNQLVRPYPALIRMQKANQLRSMLGNEVEGMAFICDARPIFNEDRDEIEGIIPITTLKVVFERQNNESDEIEFVMTPDQLSELIFKAEQARRKLVSIAKRLGDSVDVVFGLDQE